MSEIELRIQNYLGSGGLLNPELMEHDKVRDMIIDCRTEITKLREQLKREQEVVEKCCDFSNSYDDLCEMMCKGTLIKHCEDIRQTARSQFGTAPARKD